MNPFRLSCVASWLAIFLLASADGGLAAPREASRPGTAAVSAPSAYTPPSPPLKYWDYFTDNYFSLASRSANTGALIVTTSGATQATSSNTPYQQQYQVLFNLEDATYRLINRDSGLCVAAQSTATVTGLPPVAASYTGATVQRWYLTGTGGGYWAFVNAGNGLALQTDAGSPAKVTLQAVNTALTTQQWLADPANPTDHYPKRGQCGWDGTAFKIGASWFYNWSASQPSLPAFESYAPMSWGPYWPAVGDLGGGYNAIHANPKATYILGFNEPDHSDQSNATTDQEIALWPQLQALNVPLVSPATASTWGNGSYSWMSDFYNKINSKGYRVDYTAIHNYPTDPWNLDSYLNNVNSVANTWGRPVWITEFGLTGWGGNVSWTEENVYTWLAEFMWRAEDYPNLRRYSYYAFGNNPPANPWTAYGTSSYAGTVAGDNSTLTALGELYAAWDADRSVKARTAYMIQGKQSMMRLSSSGTNSPFPGTQANYLNPVSIRVSGAQAQWALVASPTAGQYYITSLLDGRRLQTDGKLIVFAAPGTTGSGVQWQIAPDSNGYFFINNLTYGVTFYSHRDNDGSGAPTGAYYGVVASGNATDFTRFRLVKPVSAVAVPTAAPATPTGVTVTPGDRRNVLRWTGAGTYFTVARATSIAGPFTTLATNWPLTSYVDNTPANGTRYYYTVTASNLLADTSAASSIAYGTPASSLAIADLEGEYKFEAGNAQDNSGNVQPGAISGGVTFFSPGKLDGYAANFNGAGAYVQLPAVIANDFSVAFWLRTTSVGGTGAQWYNGSGLVDAEVAGAATDYGVALLGGKVAFGVGNPDTTILSTSAVNDGTWHHVLATRDGTLGTMSLYVDGALQRTGTGPTGMRAAPTGIRLGALLSGGGFYAGDLDEVRLYSYVVGAGDAAKLAAGAANTLLAEYNFANNTTQDASGQGNHGAANALTFVAPGKVDAVAASFDGTSSSVQIPQSLTNDFTIAYWMNTTSAGASGTQWYQGAGLVDGEVAGTKNDFGTSLLGGKVAFGVGNPDTTIQSITSVNNGGWHHVAATRTNSNGQMRLYVDGVLQATGTGPIGPRTDPLALMLGRSLAGGYYYSGLLDDVRLYNYALTAGQVKSLVSPPPVPFVVQDIGNPAAPGYASAVNGTWTVGGSGADIWTASDQFTLVGAPQMGAGTLVARLTSLPVNADGTSTNDAKAGLMFRDGTAANAAFVDVVADVGQGVQFIARGGTALAATQGYANVTGLTAPYWLKLTVGGGNTFQAYYSTKAGTAAPAAGEWTLIGAYSVPMNSGNVQGGLAVTSHANGTLASATFDNFSLAPNTAPLLSAVPNQTLAENTASPVLGVSLSDAESPATTLGLTAATSNAGLLPPGNVVVGGSGGSRTVQFTPAPNQAGTATVTLTANDGQATTTSSFTVTVTTTAAGGWREQYFGSTANTGQAADGANPAGDGITNFFKRAFGLNPLLAVGNPASVWPQIFKDNTAGTAGLTYTRAAAATVPDLTYQVLWSHDLQNWSSTNVTDVTTTTDATAGTETHAATVPQSLGSPLFLKLQVTRN